MAFHPGVVSSPALLGRDRELGALRGLFGRATRGSTQVAFVTGEPGIGKTALADAFLAELEGDASPPIVLRTRASEQFGAGEPYLPFLDLLRQAVDRYAGEGPQSALRLAGELAPYWLAAIPVAGAVLSAAYTTARRLRESAAAPTGDARAATAADARAPSREALFFQYTELLRRLSVVRPIVAAIDDVHWADASSIGLLFHLARSLEAAPVLFLVTYRPTDVEVSGHPVREAKLELERYGLATEIPLSELREDDARALLRREGADGRERLEKQLLGFAGGNPLFVREIARWSAEQGIDSAVQLEVLLGGRAAEAPRSVVSVIERRLDLLPAEARELLEAATAEGREFTGAVLAEVVGVEEAQLDRRLAGLERTHALVRRLAEVDLPDGALTTRYEFSHPLVHAALRAGLTGIRSVTIHRRTAEAIERLYAGDASLSGMLARLYHRGRLPEKAYHHARAAAARSEEIFALAEAAELLEIAESSGRSPAEKAAAVTERGRVLTAAGRYDEALAALHGAVALALESGDRGAAVRARRLLAECEYFSGARSPDEVAADLEALGAEARVAGERIEQCRILDALGFMTERAGLGERLLRCGDELLECAGEVGNEELLALANFRAARAQVFYGDPHEGERLARQALELYERLGNIPQALESRNAIALAAALTPRRELAIEIWRENLADFEKIGYRPRALAMRDNMAEVLTELGRYGEALEQMRPALLEAEALGGRGAHWLLCQAAYIRLLVWMGDDERAVEEAERMRPHVGGHWLHDVLSTAYAGLARLALGHAAEAAQERERLLRLYAGHDERYFEHRGECDVALSRLLAAAGRPEEALAALEQGRSVLGRHPFLLAIVDLERERWLPEAEAGKVRTAALAVLREAGVRALPAFLGGGAP